jgi:hypothetical protein
MFPKKARTEIIADLLYVALEELDQGFSKEPYEGELDEAAAQGAGVEEIEAGPWGDQGRYWGLVRKYEKKLEVETGQAEEGREEPHGKQVAVQEKAAPAQRAPGGPGASARARERARPAKAPRGDQPDRKRRGRRLPAKG